MKKGFQKRDPLRIRRYIGLGKDLPDIYKANFESTKTTSDQSKQSKTPTDYFEFSFRALVRSYCRTK